MIAYETTLTTSNRSGGGTILMLHILRASARRAHLSYVRELT